MRGRGFYFYALKEDFIEKIKEVEKKLGGLQYAKHTTYKKPKLEIYDSIEKIPNIGIIEPCSNMFFIALKEEKFNIEEFKLSNNGYNYYVEDKNGFLKFEPSGIYEGTNCIIKGELSTIAETETRQLIFKELKKAMVKNMMIVTKGREYVGKNIIQNKEKYRLVYGTIDSNPEWDYDISDAVWSKKK